MGPVSTGDTAASDEQSVDLLWYKATVGQIVGIAVLELSFRLTGAYGIVDIHHKLCLVNYHILPQPSLLP